MTSLRSNNAQLSVDSAKTFIDRGQQKIFINGE